jgi:WD40 repeat protein
MYPLRVPPFLVVMALLLAGMAAPVAGVRPTGATVALTLQQPAKPAELLHAIEWQDAEQGFPAHIYQTGISADGKLFFGAGDGGPTGSVRVFEIATGKQIHDLRPGGDVWFSWAAFVPGGKYIATACRDSKDLILWDLKDGTVVRKLPGIVDPSLTTPAVSPDGKQILCTTEDRAVRLWDLAAGKELAKLDGHADKAAGVFSSDGKKILTFSPDKTLRLWDAKTGNPLHTLEGHEAACTGSFSPDSKLVLSFSADDTIRLWDVETGKEVRRLIGGKGLHGTRGFIAAGRQVAAFCDDQKYRLWDTETGRLVREIDLSAAGGDRWTMTASPDGRLAAHSVARPFLPGNQREIYSRLQFSSYDRRLLIEFGRTHSTTERNAITTSV